MKMLAFVLTTKNPLMSGRLTHLRLTSPQLPTLHTCVSLKPAVTKTLIIGQVVAGFGGMLKHLKLHVIGVIIMRNGKSVCLIDGNLCHSRHLYVTSANTRRRRIVNGQDVACRPNWNGRWQQVEEATDGRLVRTKCFIHGVMNLTAHHWLIQMGIESVVWM